MGNQAPIQEQKSQQKHQRRYIMNTRERDIVLSFRKKIKLTITDVNIFPSGFQRLRLWDASIVLSRYILFNPHLFEGKQVIQLFSGTGLGAISLKKFTKASKIAATDRFGEITQNIRKNCLRNDIKHGLVIAAISWTEYENYKTKYDYVIGTDLFFKDCPYDLLYNVFKKLLKENGRVLIVAANKQDKREEFFKIIDKEEFKVEEEKIVGSDYYQSPLMNRVQGLEEFGDINDANFLLYKITKIGQKKSQKMMQKDEGNKENGEKNVEKNEEQKKEQKEEQKEEKKEEINQKLKEQQNVQRNVQEQKKSSEKNKSNISDQKSSEKEEKAESQIEAKVEEKVDEVKSNNQENLAKSQEEEKQEEESEKTEKMSNVEEEDKKSVQN